MRLIRTVALAVATTIGATTVIGAFSLVPSPAFARDTKAEPKGPTTCDKDGKVCKKGDDCRAENCKPKAETK